MSGKRNHKYTTWIYGYLFIAPTMLGVLILNLWPVFQSFYYSFNEVKGFKSPKFVGLDNYSRLIHDTEIYRALLNTLLYCVLTVPLGVIISLVVAVFLNTKIKGKGIFRSIYFLPVVSAPVAVALVWKWLYNPQYGLINQLLNSMGLSGPDWLGSNFLALPSIAIVGIWSMIGYNMIILIAGLQNIPRSLYEAADIDGAGPIAKFFKITIPMVSPTLFFVTIITVISSFQVFDHIFMMLTPASPSFKYTESIVYLFYRYTFENYNKGYGSTIVILMLVIILILTMIQILLQKKWVHYDN
ncbi:sugar ABC transporter permease [Bacillus sp. FJAT-49711]|uniref:carbohydrate ABC transporter permease n=1 Tax=Bacillus sp. FJAT-49711 TaxID=2833585 RepID=UPI001BC936E5|nr:sugar ABC transporter permease [Bacillus sp. FJAT-49711]MBS4219084.1 sugar ABC transporter permease [Bacillus sp. FJAT-49711]